MATKTMTLRRGKRHELRIEYRTLDHGVTLMSATLVKGPTVVWEDLAGEVFPSIADIRRALEARMRAAQRGADQITLLDRVLLSKNAAQRWMTVVDEAQPLLTGIDPDDIPDEQAESLTDGRLRIFVDLPNGKAVEMILGASEWRWRDH